METNKQKKSSRNEPKKKPILLMLRFLGVFVFFVALYYISLNAGWIDGVINAYTHFTAELANLILNIFGEESTVNAGLIVSSEFTLMVGVGCEGSEPIALFLSALIAFPFAWKLKIPGFIFGTLILFFINLFRIVGLYYSGIHFEAMFDFLHGEIFPIIFIIIAMILWILWIQWASKKVKTKAEQ